MPNNVGQCFHLGMKQILEKDVQHALVTQHCSGGTTIAEKQVQLKILELPNSSRNGFASVTMVDVLGGLL